MKSFAVFFVLCCLYSLSFAQESGTISLFRNGQTGSYTSGIVQVYYDGQWQGVCSHNAFGTAEADVICHQLAYREAESFSTAGKQQFGSITEATITDVNCTTSEYQVLFQCDIAWGECDVSEAVTVSCSSERVWSDPYIGQVRLVNGDYSNEGKVNVYCNGGWGEVCSFLFNSNAAEIICEQLGYDISSYDSTSRDYGKWLWLDNLNCFSSYSCITRCQSCPSHDDRTSCLSFSVATVKCGSTPTTTNDMTAASCDFTTAMAIAGIVVGSIIGCCCIFVVIPIIVCAFVGAKFRGGSSRSWILHRF